MRCIFGRGTSTRFASAKTDASRFRNEDALNENIGSDVRICTLVPHGLTVDEDKVRDGYPQPHVNKLFSAKSEKNDPMACLPTSTTTIYTELSTRSKDWHLGNCCGYCQGTAAVPNRRESGAGPHAALPPPPIAVAGRTRNQIPLWVHPPACGSFVSPLHQTLAWPWPMRGNQRHRDR